MKALIYVPEQGLTLQSGEIIDSLDSKNSTWALANSSIDSADIGDLLCTLGDKERFYFFIKELWRVLAPDAPVNMALPHPRHDLFLSNPEYTRAILPETLEKFNAALNDTWKALGLSYPKLGHRLGVHFELTSLNMIADPYWDDLLKKQQISAEDLNLASKQAYNVVSLMHITWSARKAANTTKSFALSPEMRDQLLTQAEQHKANGDENSAKLILDLIKQSEG